MKLHPTPWPFKTAVVIVAHPDDETLWAGGTILMHPETLWTVVSLCRGNDPERAPKFHKVLEALGVSGVMGDLDDGPEQLPLSEKDVQASILKLVDVTKVDLILTHNVAGEYTRHHRHEEIGIAVLALWDAGKIRSNELWSFAYTDTGHGSTVHAIREADRFINLSDEIWERKRNLITGVYGFSCGSFEEKAALPEEAFWQLRPI